MLLIACSLLMSFLHSLWQAGALFILYRAAAASFLQLSAPAHRRNLLLLAVGIQMILSVVTFMVHYLQPATEQSFLPGWQPLTVPGTFVQAAAPWLMAAYIAVLCTKITKLYIGWHRFRQLYKAGLQKPAAELKVFATLTAHRLGIKKKVQLWLSNTISTPVTFGFLKPVILLPVALVNQLSLQQAEALVVHELTHIKVNDYLLNWFLSAAEAIFFFNPFVLRLCSHAKLEREKNCDINVLYFGSNAVQYAETLLLAAQMQREKIHWQLAAVGIKKQLLQRIHFFTAGNAYTYNKRSIVAAVFPLLAVAFVSIMALLPAHQKSKAVSAVTLPLLTAGTGSNDNQLFAMQAPPPAKAAIAKTAGKGEKAKTITRPSVVKETPVDMAAMMALPEGLQFAGLDNSNLEKEIIIEEQASGGRPSSISVYVLQYKNGQWILTPKWKATSQKILVDTGMIIKDSLILLQPVQEQ
jgi:beta-lactamase regulating signal transducer with metallopeptidase domain